MKRLGISTLLFLAACSAGGRSAPPSANPASPPVAIAPVAAPPSASPPIASSAPTTSSVDAGDVASTSTKIHGWTFSHKGPFVARLDSTEHKSGAASARLESTDATPSDNGHLAQHGRGVTSYKGKRLRLRGFAKSANVAGWAGYWMRIDREGKKRSAFENMEDRPVTGTTDWTEYRSPTARRRTSTSKTPLEGRVRTSSRSAPVVAFKTQR